MPRRPRRPCSFPGCPELTDGRYCSRHQKLIDKDYNRYQRPAASRNRYGRNWKKIRDAYISEHPFCEKCRLDGKVTKAEEVHHVLPLSEGGTNSRSNLMSLCSSCHASLHARRGDRWNPRG